MSASSSPQFDDKGKRRERPPALSLQYDDHPSMPLMNTEEKSTLQIPSMSSDARSSSSASSLDPYYFSTHSPSNADLMPPFPSTTPENNDYTSSSDNNSYAHHVPPATPARDPASIDRRGLIGVGELATPRWLTRHDLKRKEWRGKGEGVEEEQEDTSLEQDESQQDTANPEDDRGSPWTIEAIDADTENVDDTSEPMAQEPSQVPSSFRPESISTTRTIKTKHSMDESGGEEILYPRRLHRATDSTHDMEPFQSSPARSSAKNAPPHLFTANLQPGPTVDGIASSPTSFQTPAPKSPPSSFTSHSKARKRTSDEFTQDQSGILVSKVTGAPLTSASRQEKDDKIARRHRSLGVGVPSTTRDRERIKERRRADGVALSVGGMPKSVSASINSSTTREKDRERHSRHTSTSSTISSHDQTRRANGDFSHLPPSPSIQQFLRTTTSTPPLPSLHSSPSVAHSLLRGTQEGWSGLDDSATAEALRKLDGISGKTLRSRSSIIGTTNASRGNSRAGTPGGSKSTQWEGIERTPSLRRQNSASSRDAGFGPSGAKMDVDDALASGDFIVDDEVGLAWPASARKTAHKEPVTPGSARSSFGVPPAKRGSASSTSFTGTSTNGSRDSAAMSVSTSLTSTSGRQSGGKLRRTNSVGSDVSSVHSFDATTQRDRAAALAATGDHADEDHITTIPPVPPIPKEYKSPQSTSSSTHFVFPPAPATAPILNNMSLSPTKDDDADRTVVIPIIDVPASPPRVSPVAPVIPHKSPSKKWSFSGALNLLPSSHKESHKSVLSSRSPKATALNSAYQSASDQMASPKDPWSSPGIRGSTISASTSTSSLHIPHSPSLSSLASAKTPDRIPSRSGTASSASTHTTPSMQVPLSPTTKQVPSSKRLTPSAIPFFRRSSSHSIQVPGAPPSPTHPGPSSASNSDVPTTPPTGDHIATPMTTKKQSVLSLGLPSLLKSSSRKSLQIDKADHKSKEKEEKKKDEKDRSESRISVLMGRKRGKTLSSTNQPKKEPVVAPLPPMNMSAIPPSTAQRVANLKASPASSGSSRTKPSSLNISGLGKSSDSSLRTRQNLPPIAGSPSVGPVGTSRDTLSNSMSTSIPPSSLVKETPTKIPRISSRTSATGSPQSNTVGQRRTSLNLSTNNGSMGPPPSPPQHYMNEFGMMENGGSAFKSGPVLSQRQSLRSSPQAVPRQPRQLPVPQSVSSSVSRKPARDSISFSGLRKSSTASVSSISSAVVNTEAHPIQSRLSILSPSKSVKLLSPKLSNMATRTTGTATTSAVYNGATSVASVASSSRQSLSTPSPVPSSIDEEELLGDEEMLAYIKRQQARKLASGAKKEELDELLRFPEPIPPVPPMSPASILVSDQNAYLSDYERKEILDYPSVYFIGGQSEKKPATRDNTHNNHGYDDDRGDYLVVNHDHLAYRYEIIDTLGKGSFGQVLHCRDHCTGESVAIKIIRNKKRFHHQALVEIKILDNLRKWDPEEKHHVIKMTEHFYFRNHLCIAMELLSINLYELIKANGFVGFTTTLIRRFTSQMLGSLALMRHHRIVHCDLKPENVLLRHPAKSGLKVIDFGSSCFDHEKVYTYIQSRFYRSPEVILGMNYHMAIDMWSLGCILAELYTGFPIFPGENEQEQLSCIMEVLGLPDKEMINRSSRKKLFFDSTGAPRPVVNSKGRRRRPGTKTLAQVLRCDDENFVDFISKCLIWDPERRMKPQPAMRHPFLTAGRRPKPPTSPAPPPSTTRSLLSGSTNSLSGTKSKPTETPKKSLIGAPTPLTARRAPASANVPITPAAPGLHSSHGSAHTSRSYRTSQPPSVSYHHSASRNLSGQTNVFATVPAKLS